MVIIDNVCYEKNCTIYYDTFPIKPLRVGGKCLIRIGTLYEVYHENIESHCIIQLSFPRDTILVMIFQSLIDNDFWDELYHPSPRQLTSLCSIVISDYQIGYPVECQSIVQKYPVEEDLAAAILIVDEEEISSLDDSSYQTTTDEDSEDVEEDSDDDSEDDSDDDSSNSQWSTSSQWSTFSSSQSSSSNE